MRLLLDTHTFLWFIEDAPQLSPGARALIEDPSNEILFSLASLWEMAIKFSLGKLAQLDATRAFHEQIDEQLKINVFIVFPIERTHVMQVANLPFHHRDPFDRLIVAQCSVENLPLISIDAALDAYGITRLW